MSAFACQADSCSCPQRYAQSSQFKRTVLESIAEEMLEHRAAMLPGDACLAQDEPAPVCRITEGATPVVTSPTDDSMQYLYDQLGLAHANVVDRHDVSDGLHRLGESLCSRERLTRSEGVMHASHEDGRDFPGPVTACIDVMADGQI